MNAPQIIRTAQGEELVVLPRAEYDALVAVAEAAEDEADARLAAERLAEIAAGAGVRTAADSGAMLIRNGYLQAARERLGLTAAELAAEIGVALADLSAIETGARDATPEAMAKIAKALRLPAGQLV